jgi:hypothetical protein
LKPSWKAAFPNLSTGSFKRTSPEDPFYNCIAWATGRKDAWIDTVNTWPAGVPRTRDVSAMVALFVALGYEHCPHATLEAGYEKVAIYSKQGLWTHAARQLKSGRWTSKLGKDIDIEHRSLSALFGPMYGTELRLMKRKLAA